MQKVAQALVIGGLISLAIGLAISLLIGYVVKDDNFESAARLLTLSIGTNVAGIIFGVGFPVTIVGIVLGWASRPEPEAEEWEDEE
jgi:TRAP-type uncharacterized transport system fused permease subunit